MKPSLIGIAKDFWQDRDYRYFVYFSAVLLIAIITDGIFSWSAHICR